jgi:hydroxymethylpyrimidine/phosphomethylpyrimidine kinase
VVRAQLEAVFEALPPQAAKTGMLFGRALIRTVAAFWKNGRRPPLVVDPVMVASSGARLLQPSAVRALMNELLPHAMLVTPNLDETEILTGRPLREVEDLRAAARAIHRRWGCAALVKGGHLRGLREAVDVLFDGRDEWLLRAPRIPGLSTHGTGCTYSAAVTAFLARGCPLAEAVTRAKAVVTTALARSYRAAGHDVLNPAGLHTP